MVARTTDGQTAEVAAALEEALAAARDIGLVTAEAVGTGDGLAVVRAQIGEVRVYVEVDADGDAGTLAILDAEGGVAVPEGTAFTGGTPAGPAVEQAILAYAAGLGGNGAADDAGEAWLTVERHVRQEWQKKVTAPFVRDAAAIAQGTAALDGVMKASPDKKTASAYKRQVMTALAKRIAGDPDILALAGISGLAKTFGSTPAQQVAAGLVKQWAYTSADATPLSLAQQKAAAAEFRIRNTHQPWEGQSNSTTKDTDTLYAQHEKGLRKFLRAMHDETQAYFKKRGITSVVVYRGARLSGIAGGMNVHNVKLQPMSSFSYRYDTARGFAGSSYGDMKTTVMMARVPVGRIIGSFRTGFGCANEQELVVLGGQTRGWVNAGNIKWDTAAYLADIAGKKVPKKALWTVRKVAEINVDADVRNADWTKQSWDLPEDGGSAALDRWQKDSGISREAFESLPVWTLTRGKDRRGVPPVAEGDEEPEPDADVAKALERYAVVKAEAAQRYTLGVAYPAAEVDGHGDYTSRDDLERAAWTFLARARRAGVMHEDGTDDAGTVVESYIYRGPLWKAAGQTIRDGDWLVGVVWDGPTWQRIQAGELTGFSIQGMAQGVGETVQEEA